MLRLKAALWQPQVCVYLTLVLALRFSLAAQISFIYLVSVQHSWKAYQDPEENEVGLLFVQSKEQSSVSRLRAEDLNSFL